MFIGTALLFPTNAYAEEADHTPKPIQTEKAVVQNQNQATGDQVKKKKVLEKPQKHEVPDKLERQKSKKPVVKKTAEKTMEKKKALPEQASPIAKEARKFAAKKPKRADVKNTSAEKVANHSEKKSIIKKQTKKAIRNKEVSKQDGVKKPVSSKEKTKNFILKENEFVHEIKIQSPIVMEKNIMQKMSSSDNHESNRSTPDPVTSFPDEMFMIFSQGSYHSGGPAKDRKNIGFKTYSLNDKWFIRWEKYWILGPNQSFVFQNHKISSQWMNAPPFQPPKPFLFS